MRLVQKAMCMICFCLGTIILLGTFCAEAASDLLAQNAATASENQFVIMYDVSQSMIDTDYRLQGMIADFMLKVPSQQWPYKIAIIPFAGKCPETEILTNGNQFWWDIQTRNGETREKIKDMLSELSYDGMYTNIEEALRKCAQTLNEGKSNGKTCSQIVLFITDGVIDLPGDGGNHVRSRIDNIISSAERIPQIASDFPDDCQFWAIVPDDLSKAAFVTYDDAGNILSYYDKPVDADQQEGIRAALTCLDDFCSQLNMINPGKTGVRAKTIPMNWTTDTLRNFKNAYTQFFESIWGISTTTKENVDLNTEFDFSVPDGAEEVNITIMPEIQDPERCKEIVKRLCRKGNISITMNGLPLEFDPAPSIYTININLTNPSMGEYHLQAATKEDCSFGLDFLMYSNLKIKTTPQNPVVALGSSIELEGAVVDTKGSLITEQTASNLTLEIHMSDSFAGDDTPSVVEWRAGKFYYNFTATRTGENPLIFFLKYDDTDAPQIPGGISKFTHQETLTITVPEVQYSGKGKHRLFPGVRFMLQPYSVVDDAQIDIAAETVKRCLDDDWVLRLLDKHGIQINADIPLDLSEDGGCFAVECNTKNMDSAVMFNRTTGTAIDVEIQSLNLFNVLIPLLVLIFVVLAVFFVVMLSSRRKVTVSIRRGGVLAILYLNKNGSSETDKLEDESVTAYYDKENRRVVACLNGRRKWADVVGFKCDINF